MVDFELDFDTMFNLAPACEYSWHTNLGHTGAAEWSIDVFCPQCTHGSKNKLFCTACKTICESSHEISCEECGLVARPSAFWINIRRL